MRKMKLLQCLGVIACSVALLDGGYAEGGMGNLGFCIYRKFASSAAETFVFTQLGTQCMYPDGYKCTEVICTFPKQEGADITKIDVPADGKGLFCRDKDDKGQPWHFQRDLRVNSHTCSSRSSVMHIAVHSQENRASSLAFSLGTDGTGWWFKLFGENYWDSQEIPLETLQLSSFSKALSGTNEMYCPNGWCTSGEAPGSTSYIIYAPGENMETYQSQAMSALQGSMPSHQAAKFAQEARENQVR